MAEVVALSAAAPIPRILLIEDTASDALRIKKLLTRAQAGGCQVQHVGTIEAAVKALAGSTFDVALLDLSLPDIIDFDGLITLQNMAPKLPIVILTGHSDEETALAAVERGAQDYLFKDKIDAPAIQRAMQYAVQRKQFESTLITQANFDTLTGLANRTLFESRLDMAIARARRSNAGLGVFFLDLNRFKRINDTLGHIAGDHVLQQVAERLKQCLRPYDTAARFGGDEFALLIEGIEQPRDCAIVAQKIVSQLSQPMNILSRSVTIGVSIGIATCMGRQTQKREVLMEQADDAMYNAKLLKHSNYRFFTDEVHSQASARIKLEEELRAAFKKNQLTLYYQPKIDLQTGLTTGAEALARWHHPTRGLLLPGEFMAIIEETELVEPFGEWVLATVCSDMRRWRKAGLPAVPIAINLSAAQLDDPGLAEVMGDMLAAYDVPPQMIAVEVPSNALLKHTEDRIKILRAIAALGIKVHLDQFGSGAILLTPFASLPVDAVKLAPKLAAALGDPQSTLPMVQSIMDIAKRFNIGVIASGIEHEWQRSFFEDKHCREAQGFALCPPVPGAKMPGLLRNKDS